MAKIDRLNSKKYFYESVAPHLPDRNLLQNPRLIAITVDALACFIPSKRAIVPKRLKLLLSKHNIAEEAFSETVNFIVGKEKLDHEGIKLIQFLEQEAITYVGDWQEANKAKWSGDKDLLEILRQSSPKGTPNTCCYNCGKVLERHGGIRKNPHFCTRQENRECYYSMKQFKKQKEFEWQCINRICPRCKKVLTLSIDLKQNHYYGKDFYCDRKSYDAIRKSKQRDNKFLQS